MSILTSFFRAFLTVVFLAGIPVLTLGQGKQYTLDEIDANYQLFRQQADVRIQGYLKKNPSVKVTFKQNNAVYLLVDVTESGVPVFEKTDNAQVAASLNVPSLRTGGNLGINILGTGIKLATWDGGKVRNDHVELVGRVTQVDGAATLDDHATHTSGTMLASGVNASAKGMAPAATLSAFDFNNDVSEMSTQAPTLILSNHSYGTVGGWEFNGTTWSWTGDPSVSSSIDYKFGFYDSKSAAWDAMSFNAPNYLIVKSAGNDRGEYNGAGPAQPDGPYDCITTFGVAKNIMTVGAVAKLTGPYTGPGDVVMTSFSSWGPTDDGRIKPDIVAPGLNVFSSFATSTTAYSTISGTSMAAPAVTGTLGLLQQLYKSLNSGSFMRSSTLKALVIHTAREAGAADGPDYAFGWGLLDAEGAARVILTKDNQNVYIQENVLTSGQVFELNLTPKAGFKITATLAWIDPAGTPPPPSLNPPTKMLVNDLDLRLVDDGGTTLFPWILNPTIPSAAATTGDNVRDNVEKIEFANPSPRNYKLRVSNKGTLTGSSQAFSLIVTYTSLVDPLVSYYWIGDNGSWSDGSHWSLSSGGPPANAVPGAVDRAVFDEKSFTIAATVDMNSDQAVYSLRWFAKQFPGALSLHGNNLTLGESMTFLTDNVTTPTTGIINFNSTNTTANSVDLAANVLSKWSFNFNGNSSWAVTGTASVDKITVNQGTVLFTGSALKINQLGTSGTAAKTLAFSSASLQGLQGLAVDFSGAGATVQSDDKSSIIIIPSVSNSVNIGAGNFQGTVNFQGGDATLAGSGQIRSIQGNGIVRLAGSMFLPNVALSGGSQLILQDGATQTLTDKVSFATSASSRVLIKTASGGAATFAFNSYYKICFDNIDVQNINVTGASVVNAGAGSTLINSQNWLKDNCSNIIFPDFTFSYTCAKGATFFIDGSSGPVTSRSWNFGEPASSENSSNLVSPLHTYGAQGSYTATLTLSGSSGSRSVTKTISISGNDVPDNSVQLNNGKLISTQLSGSYLWLTGGQPVPDAGNSRSYNFNFIPGVYSVLTFSATCNKRSGPYLITGINENEGPVIPSVKIYPNPTSDVLQMESTHPVLGLVIMDILGRESRMELDQTGEGRYRVNVTALPAGIYVLKTVMRERTDVQKVIIRK